MFQIWLQKNPDCAEELRQHGWYCKLEVDGRYLRRGEVMLPYCPSRTWTETSVTTSEGVFLHDLQFSRHVSFDEYMSLISDRIPLMIPTESLSTLKLWLK